MSFDRPAKRIAVVGTGVIGASWTAQFLARGLDVVATDPAPDAERNLRQSVEAAWNALRHVGLSPDASPDRLSFTADMKEAVKDADLVQESASERLELKIELFAEMDRFAPTDSLLASSSSVLPMSEIQSQCRHPERCVIAHPFNPPHLIPLVEIVGGTKTSPEAIQQAMSFYASIGKKPIQLHKEIRGHVANRLQAALYRELLFLVQQGVLSISDADAVVSWGPGLRWGLMGPTILWHLAGGEGGIRHFMDHLAPGITGLWQLLGTPELTPDFKQTIINEALQEAGNRSIEQLAQERDEGLLGVLWIRTKSRLR